MQRTFSRHKLLLDKECFARTNCCLKTVLPALFFVIHHLIGFFFKECFASTAVVKQRMHCQNKLLLFNECFTSTYCHYSKNVLQRQTVVIQRMFCQDKLLLFKECFARTNYHHSKNALQGLLLFKESFARTNLLFKEWFARTNCCYRKNVLQGHIVAVQ